MKSEEVLVWIGSIGGGVGGLGGIAAIVALFYAHGAKKASKTAGEQAERGEKLAIESNKLSAESNSIAVGARELAEEANAISLRTEQRDTEIYDVRWEGDWIEPGKYGLTNVGQDEALDVRVEVSVDDEKNVTTAENVPPGGIVLLMFPRAKEEFRREVREIRRSISHVSPMLGYTHFIGERVTSMTPLGQQLVHVEEQPMTSLGDHDRY